MCTLRDVAKLAGTSIATVSNYINKTHPVSRKLGLKIATAIEELGYIPSQAAKILKSNVNKTIGVILPNILSAYYAKIYEGLGGVLTARGYHSDLYITHDTPELEQQFILEMLKKNVSGMFLIPAQPDNTAFYSSLTKRKIPFVHMDRKIPGCNAPFLGFNNNSTVSRIMKKFPQKRKFVLICGPENYSCENMAADGFGEVSKNKRIIRIPMNKESAFRAVIAHLSSFRPDVIITTDTVIMAGVIEGLSLLNYDGIEIAALGEDTWTHYDFPKNVTVTSREAIRAGEECARLLLQCVESGTDTDTYTEVLWEDKFFTSMSESSQRPRIQQGRLRVALLDTLPIRQFEGLITNFDGNVSVIKIPHRNMLKAIYSGEADVVMYDLPWLYSLAQDGILEDATDIIDGLDKSAYLEGSIRMFGEFGERYYGLPFICCPQVLFYRNDVFRNSALEIDYYKLHGLTLRPPKTWKEFNSISEFFSQRFNPNSPVRWGTCVCAAYAECLSPEIYLRLLSCGGKMFDDRGDVVFNSKNTVRAYKSFYDTLAVSSDMFRRKNDTDVVEDFLAGELAMLITYPPFMSETNELYKKCQTGQIGFAHVPGKVSILSGWGLGVSSKSAKKAEAFDFIRWACGEEIANYLIIIAGQSVINKVFHNNELINLYPWLPLYKTAYECSEALLPPIRNGRVILTQNEIDHILADNIYALIDGKVSVEETVFNTDRQIKERL